MIDSFRIQRRLGLIFIGYSLTLAATGLAAALLPPFAGGQQVDLFLWVLLPLAFALLGVPVVLLNHTAVRVGLVLLFLLPAGPLALLPGRAFFGVPMFVMGAVLLVKFRLPRGRELWGLGAAALWFVPWVVVATGGLSGAFGYPALALQSVLYVAVAVLTMLVVFEDEVRSLLRDLRARDADVHRQAARLSALEPQSALGERVAHVAHSFKNNLAQLQAVSVLLKDPQEREEAGALLDAILSSLNERIDTVLMVSQAGGRPEPETFDVVRVLEGLRYVFFTDRAFEKTVQSFLTLEGPFEITAVRWDFILMVENLVKNAYEALQAQGRRGTLKITLIGGLLTLANDGGAMPLCADCAGNCQDCRTYGRPGYSTKKGGTGQGLQQVWSVCRRYGWPLRIRTDGDWTMFQILLPYTRASGSAG